VPEIRLAQREHAKHASKDAPLFSFYFTFDGAWNIFKQMFVPTGIQGKNIKYALNTLNQCHLG